MFEVINSYREIVPICGGNQRLPRVFNRYVLTLDECGQYAVYMAAQIENSTMSAKAANFWTAAHGAKLPYRRAVLAFPNLKEKEYRK